MYPGGSPAPQQAAAQGQGHGQLLVSGGPLRGDVLQIFPGGAAGVVDQGQEPLRVAVFQGLHLAQHPAVLVEHMDGPQHRPVPGGPADLRQAAVKFRLLHLAQDLRSEQAAHGPQLPGDGGVCIGESRVVRAAVHHAQNVSGQGGVQPPHQRGGGVPEVHEHQPAGAAGQLVHQAAGLAEVHVLRPLAHPGDVRGGQAVPGEQGIAYAAQQHLKGGAAGQPRPRQHVGLHPRVKSPPGQTPPPEGGGHAPDQGGGGVPLLLPGGQVIRGQLHRRIPPGEHPDHALSGGPHPCPGGAVNGRRQHAAVLMVRVVAPQLHPAGGGKSQILHTLLLHTKIGGRGCVPRRLSRFT